MSKRVDSTSQKLKTKKSRRTQHIMITMIPSLLFFFFGLLGNVYGTSIGFGETVSGSIDAVGETDSYTFSANAGDKVIVVMATTSGNLWPGIILRNPEGNELCRNGGPVSAGIASCTLTGSGVYSIWVYDSFNGTFTGNYNLSLERLNPGSGSSISYGQKVSGSLVAGDLNSYVFTAHIGDEVTFLMNVTQGNLWPGISLYSPDGIELCSDGRPNSAEIASCILPSDGTYTLLVYDSLNNTLTGNYDLFLGIYPEIISVPSVPVGTKEGTAKNSYSYSTEGSSSNLGHNIQYFFDWGDGTNSGWLVVGETSASHWWSVPGTYLVRAQARCSRHPSVVSTWSETIEVLVKKQRPIEIWHQRYSLPMDNWLTAVAFGNDTFVTVGIDGEILTSTDGISWTVRARGLFTEYWLWDVTYAKNIFVVVGSEGVVLTSSDGINWSERASPAWGLSGITYGDNIFVAVGTLATIITSPDGRRWTKRDSGIPIPPEHFVTFESVAYGNNTFVAIGNISDLYGHDWGVILTSPDGINWTRRDTESSGYDFLAGVTYGNGIFVATGEYGTIITSPDGISWTERTSGTHAVIENVAYGNGVFVAVGGNGTILTSIDGINWEKINFGTTDYLAGVTYGNSTFVAVGDSIFQSDPLPPPTENITTPTTPSGPNNGTVGISYTYSTGGASSSLGHSVEYQFDWEGNSAHLSLWGTAVQSTIWQVAGNYGVRARARCKTDTSVVSDWSGTLSVNITSNPTLTVLKPGTGSGIVTSSPAGINCGDDCSEVYAPNTKVALTAKADTNSTFTGWSGGGCSGTRTCVVVMNADTTVTAAFSAKAPNISVSPGSLDFGSVKSGKKLTKTLKIANNGSGDLIITLSGLEGTDFCIQGSSSITIKTKKSYSLKVLCTPTSGGLKTAILEIQSNDPDTATLEISLTATLPGTIPDISVAQTSIDFGTVKVGMRVTKTLKIMNNGSGDLIITLSGLEGTDLSIQGSGSVTIKAKKSYSLKVLFTPTSGGLKTAILKITSNDPDTPILDIPLSGTGQ